MKNLFLILAFLFSSTVYACYSTSDCPVGSRCIKTSEAAYGMCIGGPNTGTTHDKKSLSPLKDYKYENTCTSDSDCKPNSKCIKSNGVYGSCM